jgi:hypothetical protein
MEQQSTVIVPSSPLRLLRAYVLGTVGMVVGILGASASLFGVGTWTAVVCAVVVGLSTALYGIAAVRSRPRVVLTPEGFTLEKVIGREEHRWQDIDGPFGVIKAGWSKGVGYRLTPDHKARVGKKPTSLFGGYDGSIVGALRCSPEELADLLNEHLRRNRGTPGTAPPAGQGHQTSMG